MGILREGRPIGAALEAGTEGNAGSPSLGTLSDVEGADEVAVGRSKVGAAEDTTGFGNENDADEVDVVVPFAEVGASSRS